MSCATERKVCPVASALRLPLRYVLAFYIIPVGVLIGVCGLFHNGLRRRVPHHKR